MVKGMCVVCFPAATNFAAAATTASEYDHQGEKGQEGKRNRSPESGGQHLQGFLDVLVLGTARVNDAAAVVVAW